MATISLMRGMVPRSKMALTKAGLCSAGAVSRHSATAAFWSSSIASLQSQSMSVVFENLHAADSNIMPKVPAKKGQRWWKTCLGVGHAFGSVFTSTSSTSARNLPSSAIHHVKP
eukprot:3973837-Prymnesium_polylepis.2